MKNFWH